MDLKLKDPLYCDGCANLEEAVTLSQHRRCKLYNLQMLATNDVARDNSVQSHFMRPDKCKEENE